MDNAAKNKERFIRLLKQTNRDEIDKLIEWIDSTDFYTAPASSRYHSAYPGGLLQHSLNVYAELIRLLQTYPEIKVSDDSAIIAALLHDLCKANFYASEKRNRKDPATGQWESYDSYRIDERFRFGGHGSKSVFLAQHFIKLSPEEAVAINCHMGREEGKDVGGSYENFPFAWLVHVADEAACYIEENEKLKG